MDVCEKLKYFEIDGKTCRSLPFDKDMLGTNRAKLVDRNVFVRNIPKDVKVADLDKKFSAEFGRVKSAKISLNKDHESNRYGFVCFDDEESANRAIAKM